MNEQTATTHTDARIAQTFTTPEHRRRRWRDFLKRLDSVREKLAAEHGPFEDSVKVLAMTRERDNDE